MGRLPSLSEWEKKELAEFDEYLGKCVQRGRDELPNYPIRELNARQHDLLLRLEEAFRKRKCPADATLLVGGLAVDDYCSGRLLQYINMRDTTPRQYWPSIAPELLRACEDCLAHVGAEAFCYLLPAYLRLVLQRPGYFFADSVFVYLGCRAEVLAPLSAAEREIVTDIVNEHRCEQLFGDGICVDRGLLPWEREYLLATGHDLSDKEELFRCLENFALEYAEKSGFLEENIIKK